MDVYMFTSVLNPLIFRKLLLSVQCLLHVSILFITHQIPTPNKLLTTYKILSTYLLTNYHCSMFTST